MNDHSTFSTCFEELIVTVQTLSQNVDALNQTVERLSRKVENPEHQKYTIDEACKRLKCSVSTFHRKVKEGLLESYQEGGRTFTTEAAILRYERLVRSDSR